MKYLFLSGLIFLFGCSKSPAEQHSTTGVIQAVEEGGKVLVIEHQEFPGFMEAMTMPFDVADAKLAGGLKAGDRVKFTITKTGETWAVTNISKLKPH